jgi:hypothetical protein
MLSRSSARTKAVLPVTVFRNYGSQKQLAHTLDATTNSARLGAIHIPIEPGEIIEIQRGPFRAKFQVFWVGAPGGLLSAQAGVKLLPGCKSIWGADFPKDEPDIYCQPQVLRSGLPLVKTLHTSSAPGATVRKFKGGASVRANGYSHAVYAQVEEICETGAHLITPAVLPPSTEAYVLLNLEGFVVEVPGLVRASDPQVGMHISFQKMSPSTREKLSVAIQALEEPALVGTAQTNSSPIEPDNRLVI